MNDNLTYFKSQFDQLDLAQQNSPLREQRRSAFQLFSKLGLPTSKHEEWKYTRVSSLFNKPYPPDLHLSEADITPADVASVRIPGHEQANTLIFVNGLYRAALSTVRSSRLTVQPLEEAASGPLAALVSKHFAHSAQYMHDGINALNTALVEGGLFIYVEQGYAVEHPVYIYHISDARAAHHFAQPRSLICVSERGSVQIVETYHTLGAQDSFTNGVMEVVVEKDALLEYYKIQHDGPQASQVSTTHIRQTGKSYTHALVISLDGGLIRNNLNMVMDADHCESHLYGLYCLEGKTHVDNHTVVDNTRPNCLSNELYKGIIGGQAEAVFNGKIFVRKDAQKTNAYQSNKNILLTDEATVNSKPQLEIFADDVKCSHGCTVGSLDEEALFYLQSRGISRQMAQSLMLRAFALDILEKIKLQPLRDYVDRLISARLQISDQ